MTAPTLKAVLYGRVSTADQEERATIALQREYAPRWCAEQGIDLARSYLDEDASGTLMLADRPAGAQLLRDAPELRAAGVSLVLLYEWSRIGREPWVLWDAVYRLEKQFGFRIKSMTQDADTSTPERVLLLCIGSGFDSMERHKTLRRSRDAMNLLAEQGAWLGGFPPFGYRLIGHGRNARVEYDSELIAGTEPALDLRPTSLVLQIYQRSADGATCPELAAWLNALGVPSRVEAGRVVAAGWRPCRVRDLLINPIYKGERTWGRRNRPQSSRPQQAIASVCPPIVPAELWAAAQETLQRNHSFARRNCRREYLLRGLVRCGLCGGAYSGTVVSPGKDRPPVYYYRCTGTRRDLPGLHQDRCHATLIPAAALETEIWAKIDLLLRDPGPALDQIAQERRERRQQSAGVQARVELLRSSLQAREAQRAQCIGWARRGIITEADLTRELAQVDREEQAIRIELQRLEPEVLSEARIDAELSSARGLLAEIAARLQDDPPFAWKRQTLERLVNRIDVTASGARRKKSIGARILYRFGS